MHGDLDWLFIALDARTWIVIGVVVVAVSAYAARYLR